VATTSIRRLIVAAIVAHLKTITVANGYTTDLNGNVVDWQVTNVGKDSTPHVEVRDPSETSERRGSMDYAELSIEIVGRVVGSIDDARNLLTDITEAMKVGPAYPSNVYQSELTGKPDFAPDEKDRKATKGDVAYVVKYRE
jgi:hypothetical protein